MNEAFFDIYSMIFSQPMLVICVYTANIWSKSTVEILEKVLNMFKVAIKTPDDVIGVVLVSLLSTVNIFCFFLVFLFSTLTVLLCNI